MELQKINFQRQLALPVSYKGLMLESGYRLDLLVEKNVVVEIKAVKHLLPVHSAQVLTYLKLGGWPAGLLMNFHSPTLREGIRRLINPEAKLSDVL